MNRNKIKSWHRRLRSERRFIEGLFEAYRNPDPKIGAHPAIMSFCAHFAVGSLDSYIEGYDSLLGDQDAPPSLRLEAASLRRLASTLADELEEIAEPFRQQLADKCDEGGSQTLR
jgi:hypothetical protein